MREQNQTTHPLFKASRVIIVGPMIGDWEENQPRLPLPPYPVLFIDGGKHQQKNFADNPTFSIGDADSFHGDLDILLPKNKNISDLKAGLDLLSSAVKEIYFFGFCGGRKDHELINLGEIYQFLHRQQGPCQAFFDKEFHAIQSGTYELSYKGIFSLLAFESTTVSLIGEVEFPLRTPTRLDAFSSLGLSNRADGTFTLSCNLPIFLLFPGGILWPQ
ncbi:MAG: hypothetical protein HYV97_10770 [Bdellovibrio sp.]|nr:hypothetical protein [Bdellovibrio sp.]